MANTQICPHCKRYFVTLNKRCPGCGTVLGTEEPPKTCKKYADIGKEIVAGNWGKMTTGTMQELLGSGDMQLDTVGLLAAILQEMQRTRKSIQDAANQISRAVKDAPAKAGIALEKERQKTADKQRKANEALPPAVTVIQCPNEIIDKLPVHRLRGKW